MKKLVIFLNLALLGFCIFAVISSMKYSANRNLLDWLMMGLVGGTPLITLYYLIFFDKLDKHKFTFLKEDGWIKLFLKRKIMEEKKKIKELEK